MFLSRATTPPVDGQRVKTNLDYTVQAMLGWLAISVATMSVWGLTISVSGDPSISAWVRAAFRVIGQAGIISGAAFAVGALLGFLFGIPRTLQGPANEPANGDGNGVEQTQAVNTNLEQISDWLTKILVGVGLTQFQSLRNELTSLGTYFAVAQAPSVTLALLLNSGVAGFFMGYLLTRLFLAGAFREVDLSIRGATLRATQLQASGQVNAARDAFEAAVKRVSSSTPKSVRDDAFEGAIFNALYETAPAGFEKAIKLGREYLDLERDEPRGRILAYLAAAYGQKYAFHRASQPSDPAQLEDARTNALRLTEKAIERDATTKDLLRRLWNPSSPGRFPGDDDLEVFFREQDQDFARLLS
jgi:hypothetical protein